MAQITGPEKVEVFKKVYSPIPLFSDLLKGVSSGSYSLLSFNNETLYATLKKQVRDQQSGEVNQASYTECISSQDGLFRVRRNRTYKYQPAKSRGFSLDLETTFREGGYDWNCLLMDLSEFSAKKQTDSFANFSVDYLHGAWSKELGYATYNTETGFLETIALGIGSAEQMHNWVNPPSRNVDPMIRFLDSIRSPYFSFYRLTSPEKWIPADNREARGKRGMPSKSYAEGDQITVEGYSFSLDKSPDMPGYWLLKRVDRGGYEWLLSAPMKVNKPNLAGEFNGSWQKVLASVKSFPLKFHSG